jgi:hypothetical protein
MKPKTTIRSTGILPARRARMSKAGKMPALRFVETLAIWSLLAVSFAAFFIAGYIIWAKCHVP